MMNHWICCLYVAFLFFILTPNVVVSLPPKGGKYAVALTHAIIFAIIYHFTIMPAMQISYS
jgi:hypothetical protein